jgi:hypothetical protein
MIPIKSELNLPAIGLPSFGEEDCLATGSYRTETQFCTACMGGGELSLHKERKIR